MSADRSERVRNYPPILDATNQAMRNNGSSYQSMMLPVVQPDTAPLHPPAPTPLSHRTNFNELPAHFQAARVEPHVPLHRRNRPYNTYDNNEHLSFKKGSYVTSYFSGRHFTGNMDQSRELTFRDDDQCSRQYMLDTNQQAQFFINILAEPAITFYLRNYRQNTTFDEIKTFITK